MCKTWIFIFVCERGPYVVCLYVIMWVIGSILKKVTKFKYLGSTMSEDGELDEEAPGRVEKLEEEFACPL